jgi:hypothetical protein
VTAAWRLAGWSHPPRCARERALLRAGRRPKRRSEIVAAWRRAGWSRKPQSAKEWRLLREGLPEPRRRDWPKDSKAVPPCQTCDGIRFSLRKAPKIAPGRRRLVRYCLDCAAASTRRYRERIAARAAQEAA